ncbi:diguanylate cyclase [Geobacter hydrogenophilus]|uniref:Diguanylate cyclase n=2 Tax=Geobacter hydrogenophilus TaxID=40983 RepID=A0A9W6G1M9_9BACT|nr:diguanylate cyclase [Geobacter hydrogenophilus]
MDNMRIRTTLTAGCFIFALLTALVGYFGGRAITKISGEFDRVAEEVFPVLRTLEDLRFAGLRIVSSSAEHALIVRQRGDAARRGDSIVLASSGIETLEDALARLQSLSSSLDPEERSLVADVDRAGRRLLETSRAHLRLVLSEAPVAKLRSIRERSQGEERVFFAAVSQAFAHKSEELDAAKAEVRQAIRTAQFTIAGASLVALILAIGGGSLIAASISRPIALLHDGVEQVGQGLLDTRIEVTARNEIGTLAAAFNRMTGELQFTKNEIVTAKNFLDNVIQSMADSLVILSTDWTIISVNPALCTLLGYGEKELLGSPFGQIVAGGAEERELLREMAERGQVPERELIYLARDGAAIPVSVSGAVMRSPTGEVVGIVCIAHDISERKRSEEEIRRLAFYDPLTRLPNRSLFQDKLTQAIQRSRTDGGMIALLFLDLDRFKDINDTLGHAYGDQLLLAVADRLGGNLRSTEFLARLGGDEFVFLVTGLRDKRSVGSLAHSILELLNTPFEIDDKELFISTSIGIALSPGDGDDGDTLLTHADMALYAAKEQGRNAFSFFSEELNREARERRHLEGSLHRALANDEFFLEYQPQIELRSGRIFSFEALVRWQHPEDGLICPNRFIPVAEETGLIRRLGEWVLRTACLQCRQWQQPGLPPVRVAVNVSGHQFNQPGFIDMVDRVLEETELDPELLELELTESSLMAGAQESIMTLIDLKVRGIHLAIDDFGTGYSSLSYLKHFPIDRLKIDRSFVRDIVKDLDDRAIVEAVIAMAHSLGLRVLAEGVEHEDELELLKERGCDEVQGFYFAHPLLPAAVEETLKVR